MGGPFITPQQIFDFSTLSGILPGSPVASFLTGDLTVISPAGTGAYGNYTEITAALGFRNTLFYLIIPTTASLADFAFRFASGAAGFEVPFISEISMFAAPSGVRPYWLDIPFSISINSRIAVAAKNITVAASRNLIIRTMFTG